MEFFKRVVMFFASIVILPAIADAHCRSKAEEGICQALVTSRGYKCQEFEVVTKDGYTLSLQRIPEGRAGGDGRSGPRPPVLLQHGLVMDGSTWLLNLPEQSLGFILADQGYDVWISNTRGTQASSRHQKLDNCSKAYWDWSWDQILDYDFPALVEFVYGQTGQKLHYVGHSLGTLVPMASFSEGKLVDKFRSTAFLAPVAYLNHITSPILSLAARTFLGDVVKWLGLAEFNLRDPTVTRFIDGICHQPDISCFDLVTAITGQNCCLNKSSVDLFFKHQPQPTSTKNLVHLAQNVRDGVLAKYDYENVISNVRHYGSIKPPRYTLKNIPKDIPLFLSHGGKDSLSDTKDVSLLLEDLREHDADKITVKFVKDYAHLDFVTGINAKEVVYDDIIKFFNLH